MENIINVSTVLGVTFGAITTVMVLLPLLKKRGIKIDEVLKKANLALEGADAVMVVADKIMPLNPTIDILKIVNKYAHIGVHQAEQLSIASKLDKDQRNIKSKETIYSALNLLNVEVTPDIAKIIDGAIEAEVLALGHKELTEGEKQAQLQQVQVQATQLQTENTQLKQTIATIQGAVQIVA